MQTVCIAVKLIINVVKIMENNQNNNSQIVNTLLSRQYSDMASILQTVKKLTVNHLNYRTVMNFLLASGNLQIMETLVASQRNEIHRNEIAKAFDIHPTFLDPTYRMVRKITKHSIINSGRTVETKELTEEEANDFIAKNIPHFPSFMPQIIGSKNAILQYGAGDSFVIYEQSVKTEYAKNQTAGITIDNEFKPFTVGFYSRFEHSCVEMFVTQAVQTFEFLNAVRQARLAALKNLKLAYKIVHKTNDAYIDLFADRILFKGYLFPGISLDCIDFANAQTNRVKFILEALYINEMHNNSKINKDLLIELAMMTNRLKQAVKQKEDVHKYGKDRNDHSNCCYYCKNFYNTESMVVRIEKRVLAKQHITYEKIIPPLYRTIVDENVMKEMEKICSVNNEPRSNHIDSDSEDEMDTYVDQDFSDTEESSLQNRFHLSIKEGRKINTNFM